MHFQRLPAYVIGLVLLLAGSACNSGERTAAFENTTAPADLAEHSEEFRKEILKIEDNIYVAIGYGLANSIMIEGRDGMIIIDAMSTVAEGEEVGKAFREITGKPVSAIVYTHNHADHIFGAKGMAGDDQPMVIAQESMPHHLDKMATVVRTIEEQRSYRMFGVFLNEEELVNCGIGPHLGIDKDSELGVIRPTVTFEDSLSIEIEGVALELFHAPGETPDQLFVWMPSVKALFCGDNFYRSFPNLYTIRGTAYRDVNLWKESLDHMRSKPVEHLIPSHTRPLKGHEFIHATLTDYRDAIQFVHDQTVRYMNLGHTPDEIVEKVRLPEHLARSPYLQEFYGKVEWTVRSIFTGYLGWFDGDPATLYPGLPMEKALRMEALAGGRESLTEAARQAVAKGDFRWALELTGCLLTLDANHSEASDLRYKSLVQLGMAESNPNARHYFLTYAHEMKGLKNGALIKPGVEMVHDLPMASIFNGMATFLNAEKAAGVEKSVVFDFPDTGEQYSVVVRNGVAEIRPYAIADPDNTVTVDAVVWKEIAAELRSPLAAFASGKIKVNGGKVAFLRIMDLFDR